MTRSYSRPSCARTFCNCVAHAAKVLRLAIIGDRLVDERPVRWSEWRLAWVNYYYIEALYCGLRLALPLAAQPVFTDVFPPEEYAARRARVMAKIGDAVAIIQGTTERPGEQPLRQANQFFYVSGVVEPRAILVIDGRTHRSKLFLNPRNERRETMMFGPGLYPGEEAAKATGIESVVAREEFGAELERIRGSGPHHLHAFPARSAGLRVGERPGGTGACHEERSVGRAHFARRSVRRNDLKEARRRTASRGPRPDSGRDARHEEPARNRDSTGSHADRRTRIMEAMRDARPGMKEYELQADAEYVFKKYGAYGPAYFALIATGKNTWYSHYHKNTRDAGCGRSGAIRLRAGFQVLLKRRDAGISGRR